jgi:hypothetical protein
LGDLPFLADDAAQALQFERHAFVQLDDLIEGVGHLARHARPLHRQADGEIAFFQSMHGPQQNGRVDAADTRPVGNGFVNS